MINVKDHGAKGDGVTLDTAAIKAAASLAKAEELYFPGGTYLLDSQLQLSGKTVSIRGEGKGLTRLLWNSTDGGIRFVGSGASANQITVFSISDITLATGVASGGTALRVEWPVMKANPQKKTRIRDIEIRGWDAYGAHQHGWQSGIWITNPGGLDLSHTDVLGKSGISQFGIKCDGPSNAGAIRHFLSNIYVLWCSFGIHIDGHIEGVYVNNFEIVGCSTGVFAKGGGPVYHISNGHTDCRTSGMSFHGLGEVKVSTVAFYHSSNGGPRTSGNIIEFKECGRISVSACSLYGFKTDQPALQAQNGILVEKSIGGVFVGNNFDQIRDTAIWFAGGCADCHSIGNRVSNCGGRYLNNGDPSNSDHAIP